MITLAGHGKDPRLVQPELPLKRKKPKTKLPKELKIGDMVTLLEDGTKGRVTHLCDRCLNIKTADSVQSHNLELEVPKLEIHTHPNQSIVFTIGDRVTLASETYAPSGKFGMGATVISKNYDRKITCTRIKVEFDDGTIYPCIEGSGWFKKIETEEKESCLHISTSSEELEPSQKPVAVQEKSRRSPTAISTKAHNKSTTTTFQKSPSIPISKTITPAEESIYLQEDFLVLEPRSLESVTDLTTQNLIYGTNTSELSTKESPTLPSSKILQDCLMENSISEWVKSSKTFPKSGIWENGKFSQQDTLDRPKLEKGCLSLPTLTTGIGSKRNAGATSCETWLKDKGFVQPTQALSIEMMCLLFGFPIAWVKSLSNVPKDLLGEQQQESSLGGQSISTVRSSQLNESSICTEFSANNIDDRLSFLLEQRDRLLNLGASPEGVWLSTGQVHKKKFRQVVWKSAKEHKWLGGNKSRYIGKENSDEHKSAIAQHKAGQELRKVERDIKSIQKKLEKS
jgi:hypothetical protein